MTETDMDRLVQLLRSRPASFADIAERAELLAKDQDEHHWQEKREGNSIYASYLLGRSHAHRDDAQLIRDLEARRDRR